MHIFQNGVSRIQVHLKNKPLQIWASSTSNSVSWRSFLERINNAFFRSLRYKSKPNTWKNIMSRATRTWGQPHPACKPSLTTYETRYSPTCPFTLGSSVKKLAGVTPRHLVVKYPKASIIYCNTTNNEDYWRFPAHAQNLRKCPQNLRKDDSF